MSLTVTVQPGTPGADYAARTTRAAIAVLHAAMVGYVVRYICGDPSNRKTLTIGERALLWAAGFGIVLVFERSEKRPLTGAAGGRADGLLAARDVQLLGYPADRVALLVAFDIDVMASNRSVCVAYWFAFAAAYRSILGSTALVGEYGDWDMIDALGDASDLHWQPNASFWSSVWRGRWIFRLHPLAHVRQRRTVNAPGLSYDPNETLRPFPVWYPTPDDPITTPTPAPTPLEDDMAKHYKVDDGDIAEFAVAGGSAVWIKNGKHRDQLIIGELLEDRPGRKPRTCSRAYLKNLQKVGPAPTYPPGYTGPRTTALDFANPTA